MKKHEIRRRFGALLGTVVICVLALMCGISHGAIYNVTDFNNPHNLSAQGPTGFTYYTLQVCVFCHTPHGANTEVHESTFWNSSGYQNLAASSGSFLLWNRDIKNSPSYQPYQSPTMQSSPQEVRIHSLLCMSCHDGISAINVMTNLPNETSAYWGGDPYAGTGGGLTPIGGAEKISDGDPGVNIGDRTAGADPADLANDHPISFDYTVALAGSDGELISPDNNNGYVTVPELRLFYSDATGQLSSLECSTCHDVHQYETGFKQPFLVMSNQNSAMCLSCHIK